MKNNIYGDVSITGKSMNLKLLIKIAERVKIDI